MSEKAEENREKAKNIIMLNGGSIRTSEAIEAGIHPRTLYLLRDQGEIEQISYGVYRLTNLPPISNPDLVTVALRIPKAVICLISALSFHELTTQVPHSVEIALKKGSEVPRLKHPPISVHWFSAHTYSAGIERHIIDGVKIQIYNIEKTIADCFKFRNKLGMDVVLESLRIYKNKKKYNVSKLLKYARICRVEKIIIPYFEAML
jgi:predicted transcriptional regulator of viral defense system